MPSSVVKNLIEQVARLQADMSWVKKWVYASTGAGMTAALGIITQLLLR